MGHPVDYFVQILPGQTLKASTKDPKLVQNNNDESGFHVG